MSNNILIVDGTAKSFKASGGDALWTPTSVANGAGRLSTQLDLGTPRSKWYRWVYTQKFAATPTAGTIIRPYLMFASSAATTYMDAGGYLASLTGSGLVDVALTTEIPIQYAGKLLGQCAIQAASTNANVWSGLVRIPVRYVSLAMWNASGTAFSSTAADGEFQLQPINDQIQ